MFSKILAPIITPNATAGLMNLSAAVFTRVEVYIYTTIPSANHQTSPIQRDKGWASSKIRPNSTVCNKAGKLLIMVTSVNKNS
jgi:capsule polysaccharide modification protein KpsS